MKRPPYKFTPDQIKALYAAFAKFPRLPEERIEWLRAFCHKLEPELQAQLAKENINFLSYLCRKISVDSAAKI